MLLNSVLYIFSIFVSNMYEVFQEGHTNLNRSATRAGKLKSRKSSKIHIEIYNCLYDLLLTNKLLMFREKIHKSWVN